MEVDFSRRLQEQYESNQNRQHAHEKQKLRLDVATAVFVGITVVINWFIWWEMKKTTEATKLAAEAASVSASAWMMWNKANFMGVEKSEVVLYLEFKNIGKTPATDVSIGVEVVPVQGMTLEVPKRNPWQCPKGIYNPGIVPADGTVQLNIRQGPFSSEQLSMISSKASKIDVHACATYRDVITQKEHITEISMFYPSAHDPNGNGLGIYGEGIRMK
jgi:hypothetical protein